MPVIVMSGHASIDSAIEATKIGASAFLKTFFSKQITCNDKRMRKKIYL